MDNKGFSLPGTYQGTLAVAAILEEGLTNPNQFQANQKDHEYMEDGIIASTSTMFTGLSGTFVQLPGKTALQLDLYVYKFFAALFPFYNDSSSWLCYRHNFIVAINFECSMCCDEVDKVLSAMKECMLDKLKVLINDSNIPGDAEMKAKSSLEFIKCLDAYAHTTGCYHFLIPAELLQANFSACLALVYAFLFWTTEHTISWQHLSPIAY